MTRILPIVLLAHTLFGQSWNVTLRSGEKLAGARLQWIKKDSLVVRLPGDSGEIPVPIPISEIRELRSGKVNSDGKGLLKRAGVTLAGGVVGFGVGNLFYRLTLPWLSGEDDGEDGPELRNVFVVSSALLGLIHGLNWPLRGNPDTLVYVLDGMSPVRRLETVGRLIPPGNRPILERLGIRGADLGRLHGYEWEVTLTSGQVYPHAIVDRLRDDSLRFEAPSGTYWVPVRVIRGLGHNVWWGRSGPPAVGGFLGLMGGAVVGSVISDRILDLPPGSPVKPFFQLAGTVLGIAMGAPHDPSPAVFYDFSGLTDEEKVTSLITYILSNP